MMAKSISLIYQMLKSDYDKKMELYNKALEGCGDEYAAWDSVKEALETMDDFDRIVGGKNGQ